jgi:hypothetical protein
MVAWRREYQMYEIDNDISPKEIKVRLKDLTGLRFGRLVAICPTEERQDHKIVWLFKCDCGNEIRVVGKSARTGNTNSCGCYKKDQLEKSFEKKRACKICKVCSKPFKVKLSHSTYEGTYCSKICMTEDYKIRFKNNDNPNYRHGKSREDGFYADIYKRYRENNKDKIAHRNRLSKAKRKKAEGYYKIEDIVSKLKLQNGDCFWCLTELNDKFHIEHVIPLAKGGTNWPDNIVISCATCNFQKKDKMPEDWFKHPKCRAIRYDYPGKTSV